MAETAPTDISRDPGCDRTSEDHDRASGSPNTRRRCSNGLQEGDEQPLESHEVIELQKFSERKAWIEEKIKFLEKMPPIEVFIGLDAIRSSSEKVPGLPTGAELQQWLSEHDAIEKETEIFDSGELQKLKKFTKAATQRNLSPEDTDLIELTLTTIYDLDKLLHLLRDRSENLELLRVRLTWEEQRLAAWTDRRNIIADLKTFLATRARWTPSVYEVLTHESPLNRKSSTASLSSDSSASIVPSALSRSTRFKLGELLSRDAAQFVGRVTSLKHGKISAAGKALDTLIENSRVPVPDELLDEQDRLEDKCINGMEGVDKFVMNVVMQWRKADEVYVETMKDKAAAQTLHEEIEVAKLHPPTARQSTAFVARVDGLLKRLQLRGNPASSSSSFPHPTHPLFPDQEHANVVLAQMLSSEMLATKDLVSTVETLAKEYRGTYEAVRRVETMCQDANTLSNTFATVIDRLENGVTVHNDDGSPPNLTCEGCLDSKTHAVYLALIPSIFGELDENNRKADQLLQDSLSAFSTLDHSGVESSFKSRAAIDIQRLAAFREKAQQAKKDITARVNRLQEARRVWALMGNMLKELEGVRGLLGEMMENRRWKQESGRSETPPTPESPITVQLPTPEPSDIKEQIDVIEARLSEDITTPLAHLSSRLEATLSQYLVESHKGLTAVSDNVRRMAWLLQSIQKQADAMRDIRSEFNDFQTRIEDLRIQYDSAIHWILTSSSQPQSPLEMHIDLTTNGQHIRDAVQAFVNALSQRVPFVTKGSNRSSTRAGFVKRRFSSQDLRLGIALQQIPIELPFELSTLDDAVRRDSNTYAMRLSGDVQSLQHKEDHLRLAWMAKELDMSLSSTVDSINVAVRALASHKTLLSTLAGQRGSTESLQLVLNEFEASVQGHRTRIARSFSPIRELLHRMDAIPFSRDPTVHEVIYLARIRAVDDAELRFNAWSTDVDTFRDVVFETQRLEEERTRLEEEERRVAEEEERAKLEALQKAEEARLLEERRIQEEEQQVREKAKRLLEQERILAEERRLIEERQAEEQRKAAEEAEKLKQEQEQQRREEACLGEERRIQAQQARRAQDNLTREQCLKEERWEAQKGVQEHSLPEAADQHRHVEDIPQATEALSSTIQQGEHQAGCGVSIRSTRGLEILEKTQMDDIASKSSSLDTRSGDQRSTMSGIVKGKTKSIPPSMDRDKPKMIRSPEELRNQIKAQSWHPKDIVAAEPEADVFGLCITPSALVSARPQEITELLNRITSLRKRLRSLSVDQVSHPTNSSSTLLPSEHQANQIETDFVALSEDADRLPITYYDPSVDSELNSLRIEIDTSSHLIPRIMNIAKMSSATRDCDNALSDLLEHIDSYPAVPMELTSSHRGQPNSSPNELLSARLSFTKSVIEDMMNQSATIADDSRVISEQKRILQTWSELEEMGRDRMEGKKSRPPSVISSGKNSSGRNSNASLVPVHSKKDSYSNLSRRTPNHGRYLTPTQPKASLRRAISGANDVHGRNSSRMSMASTTSRSTSGPIDFNSSLFRSTYASRQRTTSLTSNSLPQSSSRRPSITSSVPRAGTAQGRRPGSPAFSDGHSYSRSLATPSRLSTSSTWARTPRPQNPLLPMILSPPSQGTSIPKKRTYIANPKNKLDVAVGKVINQLPVDISVEVVEDTWKDQSGKYWIGDQDPKLCFCRILRSQTVMVRVGGGWAELSKFIKDHFADSFCLLPDSPRRSGHREEKWISSATLIEATETSETPPLSPRTPEPTVPFVPTFSLLTPSGQSPHSLKSTPPSGSPLMPIRFLRRADAENSHLHPTTPSKASGHRLQGLAPATPARHAIWRP